MSNFEKVVEIQEIVWRGDDLLAQDDLFELQEKIAKFALDIAKKAHKTDELVKKFPWLYKVG